MVDVVGNFFVDFDFVIYGVGVYDNGVVFGVVEFCGI